MATPLLPYQPEGFDQIPAGFKDPDGTNLGIRVVAVAYAYNPDRVLAASVPRSALDFLDPGAAGLCSTSIRTTTTSRSTATTRSCR